MKIGVLSLQGAISEHADVLKALGCDVANVVKPEQLAGLDGLVLPGGESTAVGKLLERYGMDTVIRERVAGGMAVMGTCTGLILMAKEITGSSQPRLGLMDIKVLRNAFGRQVDSFEADVPIPEIGGEPFRAVFIRAPYIEEVKGDAKVLAEFEGKIVMARQGRLLACAFHPELTDDYRIHRYFLDIVEGKR